DSSTLKAIMLASSQAGLDIHTHTVGDGAIEAVLAATEQLRKRYPQRDTRVALAHNELVAPHQFERFATLNATAVLSFQWAASHEQELQEELSLVGQARLPYLHCSGRFLDAGVRVAYGSDWPIDALDEWYNLQVGLTRSSRPEGEHKPF